MTKSQTPDSISGKPQTDDELVLIKKAKQDAGAFEELYKQHVQAIYKYCYNRTGEQVEAEDLTEQTFMAALEGIQQYRDDGHFAAWLFSIARRKVADYFRSKDRLSSQEIPEDIPMHSDFLGDVIRSERQKAISEIFNALPENKKELIRLRYVADLNFATIAQLLHRSEGSVKKATYRTIDQIRKKMEERYG
ncbi:MAG TPA: RNA polymerase sigma factor [Anaerolineaceae bacterium]|mgnify:CR=1 FL=1|jgi:RNA polymerase sigma factor (sigma-70 family)|nr:RNA polymerase sigma factor [Anaerolineaceae bacterium]